MPKNQAVCHAEKAGLFAFQLAFINQKPESFTLIATDQY